MLPKVFYNLNGFLLEKCVCAAVTQGPFKGQGSSNLGWLVGWFGFGNIGCHSTLIF